MPFRVPGTDRPYVPPPARAAPRGLRVELIGGGRTWGLSDLGSPVRLGSGSTIFSQIGAEHYEDVSAGIDGVTWLGYRHPKRTDTLWLSVRHWDKADAWSEVDEALWRIMDPATPFTIKVYRPDGTWKTQRYRIIDDGGHATFTDPLLTGFERYRLTVQADWPYAQGEPIRREFEPGDEVPFFGAPGAAYVFNISKGDTISVASISNPGDVDAFLHYAIHGSTTSVTVRGTEIPFPVASGKAVLLDTDPRAQTALEANVSAGEDGPVYTLTGVDLSGSLGQVNYTPLAPGTTVPVTMSMVGTGRVIVTLTPNYRRLI